MSKQKHMYSCIVVLLAGVLTWALSLTNHVDYAWLASIPIGILAIILAVKINADSFEYKVTRGILIGKGILLLTSFYFVYNMVGMIEDISQGYVDKNIVVVAPIKGTIPVKAGNSNELDKNDNKERIVCFVRTNCPACESFSEVLEKAIHKTKAEVYYYNTEEMKRNEAKRYVKKFKIKYVPILMKIKNGKATKILENNRDIHKIYKFLK